MRSKLRASLFAALVIGHLIDFHYDVYQNAPSKAYRIRNSREILRMFFGGVIVSSVTFVGYLGGSSVYTSVK
jgi:hypothetical protein